jgi:hypothetical protein
MEILTTLTAVAVAAIIVYLVWLHGHLGRAHAHTDLGAHSSLTEAVLAKTVSREDGLELELRGTAGRVGNRFSVDVVPVAGPRIDSADGSPRTYAYLRLEEKDTEATSEATVGHEERALAMGTPTQFCVLAASSHEETDSAPSR